MNYARLVLAAVAATVFDAVYGFLVWGTAMAPEFEKYPGVYRPADTGPAYLPLMFGGLFIAILAAAIIYAKGYEGGSGLAEGARFGVLLGVFVVLAFASVNYATLNVGRTLAVMAAAASFVEWLVVGTIIGLVYKPVTESPREQRARYD
jgi:hypothetical protein